MSAIAAPASPFKGLSPFDDSDVDALLFFGRSRETEVIAANLQASRLTVLYGPSGVGKSSILRAGVAHRLRREADVTVEMLDAWAGDAGAVVEEALRQRRDDCDLYLILDQFEEYFIYRREDESLPRLLGDVVGERGLRVNMLIGIREDALARLDAFRAPIPNLLANRLRLEPLDREAARAAILGPVARFNELTGRHIEVDAELVEEVLDDVAAGRVELERSGRGAADVTLSSTRVEAPYLQLVLERLWDVERSSGSDRLRVETLRSLGGAARIVREHLERAMSSLTDAEQQAAAEMYHHLVTPSGMKIAHRIGDLAGYASVAEPEAAVVLDKLTRERIVRASSENGPASTRYEIYHDVLADAVLAWRARHEEARALQRAEDRRRRAHRVAAAALLALIVVVGIAVFALLERSNSRAEARRAHARQLASDAVTLLGTSPQQSLRLALKAMGLESGAREEDVLRSAIGAAKQRAIIRPPGGGRVAQFDPRGKYVLVGCGDGNARMYRVGNRRAALVLPQGAKLTNVAFSADGSIILTAGVDDTVRLWTRAGRLIRTLAAGGPVGSASFGAHDTRVLTLTNDGQIRLWRTRDGRRLLAFRVHGAAVPKGGAISPKGTMIVTFAHDRFARVYSARTGRLVRSLEHGGFVYSVAFSRNGRFLLTASHDKLARLWRVGSFDRIRTFAGSGLAVLSAVFSPDEKLVAGASADGTGRVWITRTGFPIADLLGHGHSVTTVAFNPSSTAVVTGSSDATARTWESRGRPVATLAGHTQPVAAVAFSPTGRRVLTTSADGTVRLWDPGTEAELVPRVRQRVRFTTLAVSPDGARVIAGDAAGVATVRTLSGMALRTLRTRGPVTAVAFGPHGAVARSAPVTSLAFAGDGRIEAVGTKRGIVALRTTAGPVRRLRLGGGSVHALAFSHDARLLAAGTNDGRAFVLDTSSGRRIETLAGHTRAVTGVVFGRDATMLLTSSKDGTIGVWSVSSGTLISRLRWHFGPVSAVALSPDGHWIVTAGPSTAGIGTADGDHTFLRGPSKPLVGAVFAGRDGRFVVTASKDGTIRRYRCVVCGDAQELERVARRRLAGRG
ncbi:MAG: hypothetical protein ACJ747_05260 [Gaiellaceae bacterium]